MSVSDTFFAEKNTWVSSAKHFLSNKKETTDFTVYLRNSTNPIVSLTLRQAIRFSFSIADQQLCKLLLAICPFRQPNIIITASHFICQPLPGKSSRQTHEHVTVHAYVSSNGICRGFAFQYGKFLLPPRFLTALSVPKVPTREQKHEHTECVCSTKNILFAGSNSYPSLYQRKEQKRRQIHHNNARARRC